MGDVDSEQETNIPAARVDVWDGAAVKNALDDAVRRVLVDQIHYKECHRLMDIRLAICLTAVGAAMFALVWDFLNPFPDSKPVLIFCVISYFILMAILTVYTTTIEKGIFLEALDVSSATGAKWTVSSNLKRFDDLYSLCLEYSSSPGIRPVDVSLTKSVSEWFTVSGELVYGKFESEVRQLHNSLLKDKKNK